MAKKQRRARQPDRDARRRAKLKARRSASNTQSGPSSLFGGGWSSLDDFDDMVFPDPPVLDWDAEKQHCPVDDHCAGCDRTDDLHVMLSVFGADEIACVTVCPACDGRSVMHLREVGPANLDARVSAHQQHRVAA